MAANRDRSVFAPMPARSAGWIWAIVALTVGTSMLMLFIVGRTVWGAATLTYTLTEDALIIRYGYQVERIERAGITAVYRLEPTRGRRVMGTGLRRLQEGWFTFRETGRIKLHSTTTHPLTVIETAGGKWGISPADADGFLAALDAGRSGEFPPVPGAFTFGNLGFLVLVGGVVGILLPAGLTALMIQLQRAPRAITYTLNSAGLEIRVAWSRIRLRYDQITGVEIATPAGYPFRLFGASLPGLYWGRFHWRQAGPGLRLYATRYRPLVLVRTARATYGISPADDARFVAELQARLG